MFHEQSVHKQAPMTRNIRVTVRILIPLLFAGLGLWLGGQVLAKALASTNVITATCIVDAAAGGTHPTIQAAASDTMCTDIKVAAGFYDENVVITRSVSIRGAGPSQTTVLGGSQDTVFTIGDKSSGVGPTHVVRLAGMKVQFGMAAEGGGIYNDCRCHLTVDDLEITGNGATTGGGIANYGAMTITNSSINGSIASTGSGIYSGLCTEDSALFISNSGISGNWATGNGGGLFLTTGAEIHNSRIVSNSADQGVAGMVAGNPASNDAIRPIIITETTIQGNIGTSTGGVVVYNHATIDSSQIISNTGGRTQTSGRSVYGGGVAVVNGAVLTLTNSIVSNNILDPMASNVLAYGGGIYVGGRDNRLWMVNTTVTNNEPGGIVDSADAILFPSTAVVEIKDSDISNNVGGGISGEGTLTITNSQIDENTGGGIAYECAQNCGPSSVTLQDSQIHQNGGLGLSGNEVVVTNSTIDANSGAGIEGDNIALRNSVVSGNGSYGVHGNDVDINHSVIDDNAGYGVGGSDVYVQLSTIKGHSNTNAGGGVKGENVEIRSSTIHDNHSDRGGGGIRATNVLTVVNSTISGNTANGNGGGIALSSSGATAHLDSVTVVYNTADLDADDTGDGGGIYRGAAADTFFSEKSIIAENQDLSTLNSLRDNDCAGGFTSGHSNLIGDYDGVNCTGFALDIQNVNPRLRSLGDNGGPTWTHALRPASPAVDSWLSCPDVDQRGVDRPQDGGSGNVYCDIGAYERGTCAVPVVPTLTITRSSNHIQLEWDRQGDNREVEIARGTDPFSFTTFSILVTNLTGNTDHTDYDAIGDPLTNYFYKARGQNACGDYSTSSNIVGEVDVPLDGDGAASAFAAVGVPRSLHFAVVALPLEGANLPTTADGVADYIDPAGSVRGVARWNTQTTPSTWVVRRVGSPFGTPDFAVSPGDVLLLGMTSSAPETFAWVGDVPAAGAIQNDLVRDRVNAIIVPLDQSGAFTMDADGLAGAIGGVARVAVWSPFEQRWYVRNTNLATGPNFDIQPGMPYAIRTDNTAPLVWP